MSTSSSWRQPRFWYAQLIVWLVVGVSSYLSFLSESVGKSPMPASWPVAVRALSGLLLSSALPLVYDRLPALLVHPRRVALVVLAVSAFAGVLWYTLFRVATMPLRPPGAPLFGPWCIFSCLLDFGWFMLGWSVLFLGARELQRGAAHERQLLQADRLMSEARYQALVFQVNPHFLFNTLNSVRALIDEDGARARVMVTRLAAFLRFSLDGGTRGSVPLQEELAAVAAYLEIEQVRFESRLRVRFDIAPETARLSVPVFLLLPLVENAIRHGFAAPVASMELVVVAARDVERLTLEVRNTGTLAVAAPGGAGIGLGNIRARLAYLFPQQHTVELGEAGGFVTARITLPTTDATS